jgi:hypothetical protein
MLIHFIHGYYCIYRPWQPLTYLYFPYHCISLIYFSFTKIRMFLYAQIYWLAEFGDVSCLQFNYLRVETLTPTWEDLVGHLSDNLVGHLSDNLVGHLSDNFKSEVRQNSVSDLSVWSLIHLEGSVHASTCKDFWLKSITFLPVAAGKNLINCYSIYILKMGRSYIKTCRKN